MLKSKSPGYKSIKGCSLGLLAASLSLPTYSASTLLEEVVVTAQKREQNLQDVGVSVTAFGGEAMKALGFTNSTDLAAQTPGLNIGTPVGEGNNPSIVLRGVGLNDFNDNNEGPVAMYKDEVYISAMAGQTFQLFDVERVEVLRGPQGTLYGRNATGGLVHYISNKPTEEFAASLDLTLAEYNQVKVEGAVSGGLGDSVQGRLAVATNRHDGYVDNRVGPDANQADSQAMRALLNVDVTEDVSLLFNLHYGKSDTVSAKYQQEVTDPSGMDFWGYADTDGDEFEGDYDTDGILAIETVGGSVTLNWESEAFTLTSITAVEELDKHHIEDTDMGPLDAIVAEFRSDAEQFSQEIRFSGETEKTRWVAGLYYFESEVKGRLDLNVKYFGGLLNFLDALPADQGGFEGGLSVFANGPYVDDELVDFLVYDVDYTQDSESTAIFGQMEYDLSDTLALTLGLRYTTEERELAYVNALDPTVGEFNAFWASPAVGATAFFDFTEANAGNLTDIDNDNVSGKIGLDYRPNEDWLVFASVSRGFKSGGFNAGFLDESDGLSVADTPYDEEILTSYEVGFKADISDSVRLNAAAFYYDYQDYQALSFSGLSQFITNSDATVQGMELELQAAPTEGLEFQLGMSLIDTEVEALVDRNTGALIEDTEMVLAPELTVNGLVRYQWEAFGGNMVAQADFNHQDDHFFDITNKPVSAEDAYTVWNARLAYKTDDDKLEAAVFVKNLTDEEYRVYTFDFTAIGGFNQQFFAPPRWAGVSFAYKY